MPGCEYLIQVDLLAECTESRLVEIDGASSSMHLRREREVRTMCDYSLMMVPNRLAIEGEELVAHRFQSGTTGFVSCSDFDIWLAEHRSKNIWRRLKACLSSTAEPTPVVCIPPGARLLVERSPEFLNGRMHQGSSELATFTQLSAEANQHRDALCFDDGVIVRLAMLAEGQRVKVLRLASHEETEFRPETAQRVPAV